LFLAFLRASGRAPIQVRGLEEVRPSKKTAHLYELLKSVDLRDLGDEI